MKTLIPPAEDEHKRLPQATQELSVPEIDRILQELSGTEIEKLIITLAEMDGEPLLPTKELPTRYAVNTLALTEEDLHARTVLRRMFLKAGMTIEEHPLGLIATYEGENSKLPAIGMLSHYDSVPTAGMYDGTVGILSAIHIVQTLKKHRIKPRRSIKIIALTGEESARFNIALFGSKGMFHGLSEAELKMHDSQGITIENAIEEIGFDPNQVKKPRFSRKDFEAIIEFHVAQDDRFPDKLSVIEAIAAPERYKLEIGRKPVETHKHKSTDRFLTLTVNGKTGHSGATPMGSRYRTDGLVLSAELITEIHSLNTQLAQQLGTKPPIVIGNLNIEGQAMNKIPGKVTIPVCITGNNSAQVEKQLLELLARQQTKLAKQYRNKSIIAVTTEQQKQGTFYDPQVMQERQLKTMQAIKDVNRIANLCTRSKCVGTVTTYATTNGVITVGIDLRGINEISRRRMIAKIKREILATADLKFSDPLPGSGSPEVMDRQLVAQTQQVVQKLGLPFIKTFSPAGHDIQNVRRAGIKTVMIQCPSRNGGIAHTPDEYSTPLDLEWGAKSMAALVIELAEKS